MTLPSASAEYPDSPEARRYNRIRRALGIADFLVSLAFLAMLLLTGWTATLRDIANDNAGDRPWLAIVVYVALLVTIAKLLGLALDVYGFRLEHHFHLSNQKFRSWVWDEFKGWVIGLVIAVVVVEIIYWLIRTTEWWWLWAWLVFIVLYIFFAQIVPVVLFPLFYKFKPLHDEDLKMRLVRMGQKAGARVRGVYEWKLSEKSKKANAALTGLGATRRIILSDTLLANYTHDEIEAVLAHELGHHVHRHIPKAIFLQVMITFLGFWAADYVLHWAVDGSSIFAYPSDIATLPLLALLSTVFSFLLLPFLNAYSRYNERQADRYCWQSIHSVDPYITAMSKLAAQNLAERAPSRMVEWLFHSHPPINKRIDAARAFARAHKQRLKMV